MNTRLNIRRITRSSVVVVLLRLLLRLVVHLSSSKKR